MNYTIKKVFVVIFMLLSVFLHSQNIKIMTYNIRLDIAVDGENAWSHRKGFFTSQLQFYEPDIFGIQEATPNQVIDISNALPQYNHIGIGREGLAKEKLLIYFTKRNGFQFQMNPLFGYLKRQMKFQRAGMRLVIEFARLRFLKI
jgi:hypothetical protein